MYLITIVGGTGQGKSHFLNSNFLKNKISPVPSPMGKRDNYFISAESKRQYIFDINNEYVFPDDRNGMRFQQIRHIDADQKRFISNCNAIQNTNIVYEDASGFLRGKQSDELIRLIVKRRHVGNNWFLLFHSVNRVPPEIMEYTNYIVLFRTGDNLKDIQQKFSNEKLDSIFNEINNSPKSKRFVIQKLL